MAKSNLKFRSLFGSTILVPDSDALIILEPEIIRDRMRRLLYNRIESVTTWQRVPWASCIFGGILTVLGAVLAVFNQSFTPSLVIGIIVAVVDLIVLVKYAWYKRTYLTIARHGEVRNFSGVVSPGSRKRFVKTLNQSIRNYQQAHQPQTAAPASELEPQIDLDLGPSATATSDPPIEPDLDPPAPD